MAALYTSHRALAAFFRSVILVLALLFAGGKSQTLQAQIDITIGTGTTGNTTSTYPCPIQDWFEGSRAQYLYRASELTAAGMGPGNITSIKYNVVSIGTAGLVEQYNIRIGTTTATGLTLTTWEPGTTSVYGPVNYTPVAGINTFTFSSPFFWNGTDNIIIEICNGEPGNATGTWFTQNPVIPWTTGLAFNASHTYRADNLGNLCGSATTTNTGTATTRPNIVFGWVPAVACSGTPTGGATTSDKSVVCLGEGFNLTVSGASVASGITYQWQSSPDNSTWTDITGATSASLSTSQTASTYYRRVITCTNGGASSNSTPVQVISPSLVSGSFTINSALPTGGTNFTSFNDAYNYIKCGINGPVVFNVDPASGPYTEQLIMTPVPGASNVNTVTFNGNGRTLRYLSTNTNERAVIKLNGADHIRFDNLVITAQGTTTTEYGFGVQLINDADSNIVRNCTININTSSTSTNYAGIVMNASATSATTTGTTLCDFNRFENNTVNGGYYGITMVGSTTSSVARNMVVKNTFNDQYNYGVYLSGNFNSLIDSNTVQRPARTAVTTLFSIYATSLNTQLKISRNTIRNPFGGAPTSTSVFYGIYFTGVDAIASLENVVSNNLIYNITGSGDAYGIYNTSSDNVWYYHNTVVLDGPAASSTASNVTRGFYQTTLAGGIELKDNIFTISRGGPSTKHALYFNTNTTTYISNNNNFNITSTTGTVNLGIFNAVNYATLATWQAGTSQDAASQATNPVYQDIVNGNYTPTNAVLDNLGTPVGITDDLYGTARSATTPDIGAIEFAPGACVAPPIPGTSTLSVSPVCVNFPVTLSITGNSTGLGQTYQWQASVDNLNWNNITTPRLLTDTTITAVGTSWYRCAVRCGASTVYSEPVLLTVNPALPGGSYTINSALPTGGTNYQSFNDARIAMQCGIAGPVVFNVAPSSGPYNEQLILDSIPGSSAVNTITFNGNGNTIAFSSSADAERAVIKLRKTDHVTFDSLTINATGAGTYGYGVQLINGADSNRIRRCTIVLNTSATTTNFAGIVVNATDNGITTTGATNCDGNTFELNNITGGYAGITLVGNGTTAQIFNNRVLNNIIKDYYIYGTYLNGNVNAVVEGNDYSRPTRTTTTTFYGVYVTTEAENLLISKNKIHNPFGGNLAATSVFYGIFITAADATAGQENKVINNLIYDVNGESDEYGIYNTGSDNLLIYHNTISLDNQLSNYSSADWARGIFLTGTMSGVVIKNNMITITRTGNGTRTGLYFATSGNNTVSNRNNIYVQGPANTSFVGFLTADQVTLANWQTASGQDANSVTIDPEYSDPATVDFTPTIGPLENLGEPVGVGTDIRNINRSATTPDIGAFEFTIIPCVAPPTPGTAVVTPNSGICIGTTVALTLTGNSTGGYQTYQWQSAPSAAGPWTNISPVRNNPNFSFETATDSWFRCVVTCSGNSQNSTPAQINFNPALLAGTYTIDPALPLGGTNYQSFNQAVAALECGITGTVIFNVAAGTYTEQVRMHRVYGASATARVIFQAANGNPASVTLTNNATVAAANYTLKLDSASFITWKNLTITGTNATNGRVIELANTASSDSIVNCVITAPAGTGTGNTIAGIFATGLRGSNNVIKGNTINNGNAGVSVTGLAAPNLAKGLVIDSNSFNGFYYYGIYTSLTDRLQATKNTVNLAAAMNATAYGIYMDQADSAYNISRNTINFTGTTGTKYGLYMNNGDGSAALRGEVSANTISTGAGNTSILYGLYNSISHWGNYRNNAISINTSGATSYGLYSTGNRQCNYWNNSVLSTATSATNNFAAYFSHTSGTSGNADIRNNIFSHQGGGIAMHLANTNFIYSDYNMLFTSGANLVRGGTTNYTSIAAWRAATEWDVNSIVYQPAFTSTTDLRPVVSSPDVWAMHGRGVQITGNNADFNGAARPATLVAGVPDLGAFEFVPTSIPPDMVATPALPAPNTTQKFSFGTDTVSVINWGATVPATITGKRYSGVTPPGLTAPADKYMYFYTDFTVPAGSYDYTMNQYYIDPWQGYIPSEPQIRLAKTNAAGAWTAFSGTQSTLDDGLNIMTKTGLTDMFKFTGLINGVSLPTVISSPDSSNQGRRFWVPYAHNFYFESDNSQQMVLYLSAEQAANVTVKINGTAWVRNYAVPAGSVITTVTMPKLGVNDARVKQEGLSDRAISIVSDVPIVAYAHVYGSASSGASMLLPVGAYGYEYSAITSRQNYSTTAFSHVNVIAEYDSTVLEITPSNPTRGGRPAGVPFTVVLNKGQVYQLLGELTTPTSSVGLDLTGTKVRALPNSAGKCLPFAMFSGSSRTAIVCGGTAGSGNGDFIMQQNFPVQAWGRKYLTAPTSNSTAANSFHTNIYRVTVKDPSTVVLRNGVALTGLINNLFYEFESQAAEYIESDKPVMVAQFMPSSGSNCANSGGNGDPEMFYISPLEQAVKKVGFYRNTVQAITLNYLTLIVPTNGVASLTIDGSNTFDHTYAHPNLTGYTVVVKRWTAAQAQTIVQCDSAFTAITYGEGSVESYGYNAGTLVKNLNGLPAIVNTNYNGPGNSEYTCAKTPFRFSILIPVKPSILQWGFSQVANLTPNTDVIQNNPVAIDSVTVGGRMYYKYTVNQDYVIATAGTVVVPIFITHPDIEGCNSRLEVSLIVDVRPAPVVDFGSQFSGCVGDAVQFTGSAIPNNNDVTISSWNWNFGDATAAATIQNPLHTYANAGTYNVKLSIVGSDGCIGDTTKPVVVNARPVVQLVSDSIAVCTGQSATFTIQNPVAGATYNWYDQSTGGTLLGTGNTYTVNNVTAPVVIYAEGISNGCVSITRKRAVAVVLPPLAAPVVVLDSAGVNFLRFRWNAVPNAATYEVSVNGGPFITPSSGATGLTHTVTGLLPLQTASVAVRANGIISCQQSTSQPVQGRTLPDQIYIPNAFSPNGDGLNDVLKVYGYVIKDLQFSVFNQWGEKVFETRSQATGWDGSFKGKQQPAGVYMYVCRIITNDGQEVIRKGSINLVR